MATHLLLRDTLKEIEERNTALDEKTRMLESLSVKRQRMLPARCRVYDLLNFASEIATHRAPADSRPRLQAYIGTLVSDEFDLEGTAEKVPEFKDLFLNLN